MCLQALLIDDWLINTYFMKCIPVGLTKDNGEYQILCLTEQKDMDVCFYEANCQVEMALKKTVKSRLRKVLKSEFTNQRVIAN